MKERREGREGVSVEGIGRDLMRLSEGRRTRWGGEGGDGRGV